MPNELCFLEKLTESVAVRGQKVQYFLICLEITPKES